MSIIISVSYIILFCSGIVGILLYPKAEGTLNGIKILVMGIMAIFGYQALMAWGFNLLGVRVDLMSTCISMLIMDICLWIRIFLKKNVQKLFWRVADIVSIVAIIIVVYAVGMHLFSADLLLRYRNIDAASHFSFAMEIVQSGKIYNIYFSAFIDAMFIELFAPVLATVEYYKAFILADIFMHMLEVCMYYVLAITISDKKIIRVIAPIFSMAYFWGYPAYSYMIGNFVYWSNGVMILMFIIYALLLLEKRTEKKCTFILLGLGIYANFCCNKLFIVVNSVAILGTMFALRLQSKRPKMRWRFWGGVIAVSIGAIAAFVWYVNLWGDSIKDIIQLLSGSGGIYRAMYADLIFFVPPFFIMIYYVWRKRYPSKVIAAMSCCMILCTIGMYMLWYNYLLSTYYYYKIYYNLWLLGWLVCVNALDIMAQKRQLLASLGYGGMVVVIGIIVFSGYDVKMQEHNEEYNASYATTQLFPLYRMNSDCLLENYGKYEIADAVLEVFDYSIEKCDGEYIPIVVSDFSIKIWYDSLKGIESNYYNINEREFPDIITSLAANGVEKILVIKDESYEIYEDYFKKCVPVYENEAAAIYTFPGISFADLWSMNLAEDIESEFLFSYIKSEMENEEVPLVAAQDAYLDYIIYYNYVGKSAYEYSFSMEDDLEEYLDKLEEKDVNYMMILYKDKYYQKYQAYFDEQEIVCQNSSGKIVKCIDRER